VVLVVKSPEHREQASLVDAKGRAFDAARGDEELPPEKRVLDDKLGTRVGQIGDEAALRRRRAGNALRSPCIVRAARLPTVARSREPRTRNTARPTGS
jgi:hypothetical protein